MKNTKLKNMIVGAAIVAALMPACRDEYFEEFDKVDDSLTLNGKIAFPLINSAIKFSDIKVESINSRLSFDDKTSDNITHMIINQDDRIIALPSKNTPIGIDPIPVEYIFTTDKQDLYKEIQNGTIKIKNPIITLETNTEKGSNLKVSILEVDFYNKNNKIIDKLTPQNNPTENKATLSNDNTNGKLTEILDQMPDYYTIKYKIVAEKIEANEIMKVNIKIDLPLEVIIQNYEMSDTCEVDMDEIWENTEKLLVKCKAENGMPFNMQIKAYFMAKGTIIDSIFVDGPWEIDAAQVDNNGNVQKREISSKESTLDKKRIQKLDKADCDHINYKIIFSTIGNDYTKVTDKQILDLRMSICGDFGYTNN